MKKLSWILIITLLASCLSACGRSYETTALPSAGPMHGAVPHRLRRRAAGVRPAFRHGHGDGPHRLR